MGMAIVQKCLDLLNATATVHSQIDAGTTFTLTFPNNTPPNA
jgi:signal transduction histidine kinase